MGTKTATAALSIMSAQITQMVFSLWICVHLCHLWAVVGDGVTFFARLIEQKSSSLNLLGGLVDSPAVLCFAASFELKLQSHRTDDRHGREMALRRLWGAPDRIHPFGIRPPSLQIFPLQKANIRRFSQSPPDDPVGGPILFCRRELTSNERMIGGRR